MRVSAALVPSVAAVRHLDDALERVRALRPELTWVPADHWHVPLAYFGNISQRDLDRLDVALQDLAPGLPALDVHVSETGAGPDPHQATSLWAHVHEPGDRLQGVATAVLGAVEGFGWMLDRRVFRPQIVLARSTEPVDVAPVLSRLHSYTGPDWRFDTLATVWVRAADDGTQTPDLLETYPLAGAG